MAKSQLALTACAAFVAVLLTIAQRHAIIIYNHSPSIPVGLYVRTTGSPMRGAIVTVRASDAAPLEARRRRFDSPTDFFIKRVAAAGGDLVCATGVAVNINGRRAAIVMTRDATGRLLSRWHGCRRLDNGEVFLLGDTANSFDGRYWGPIEARRIEGVWRPLF